MENQSNIKRSYKFSHFTSKAWHLNERTETAYYTNDRIAKKTKVTRRISDITQISECTKIIGVSAEAGGNEIWKSSQT